MTAYGGAVMPLSGHVSPYATTGLAAGTRTPAPTPANAEELGHAVRAYVEKILTEGSVWSSDPKTAVLRQLRRNRAWTLFGEAALTAAASHPVHACCTFGLARLLAIKLNVPAPLASPALDALLGRPCPGCVTEIAAERKAARDVAAGRRRSSRPAAIPRTLTASGDALPWWGRPRPDRKPTPEEDAAFLAEMARHDAARRRLR
jgi:hypothetical protein